MGKASWWGIQEQKIRGCLFWTDTNRSIRGVPHKWKIFWTTDLWSIHSVGMILILDNWSASLSRQPSMCAALICTLFLYPATQKVAGYYFIPSELWLSFRSSVVHPSVCLSALRFRALNCSTFWPIFFKFCIDIGIGEEWYGIASGLIFFWNNRVMALDVCQKCFALRFRALTLVPFYWFSSNFA